MAKKRFIWPGLTDRIAERLDATGYRANLSDLARKVRVILGDEKLTTKIVGQWCRAADPSFPESIERLAAFAEALGTTWQWLIVGDEGAKLLSMLAPHHPIVMQVNRGYQVAKYERTENDVSVYRISHREVRALKLAITVAKQQR